MLDIAESARIADVPFEARHAAVRSSVPQRCRQNEGRHGARCTETKMLLPDESKVFNLLDHSKAADRTLRDWPMRIAIQPVPLIDCSPESLAVIAASISKKTTKKASRDVTE